MNEENIEIPEGYGVGIDKIGGRHKISHLYKLDGSEFGKPMCKKGWNRGKRYSIIKGQKGKKVCELCLKRALEGKEGVDSDMF